MKKTCIICGREFYTQISNKITCSPVCAKKRKQQTERKRHEKQAKFGKVIEAKVCPECGKTFTPDVPQRVYCSNYCSERHRRAAHNLSTRKPGPAQEYRLVLIQIVRGFHEPVQFYNVVCHNSLTV